MLATIFVQLACDSASMMAATMFCEVEWHECCYHFVATFVLESGKLLQTQH